MRKNCSRFNFNPFTIFIMVLATALLFSSCSAIIRPIEKEITVNETSEIPAGTSNQNTKDEENSADNTDASTETDDFVSIDVEVKDYSDDSADDKAANEDASNSTSVDTGNEAVEFDAAKDMQLGALKADMPKDEVEQVMESELVDSATKNEYGMETETLTYKDGTIINLLSGKIYSISVKSSDYATPRGLKAGDTEETLRKLYGEPTTVEDGKWIYSARGYDLFFVTVENGIVTEIMISQVL
jgi:hypothetical protein